MATFVLTNPSISVNSVDLSSRGVNVAVAYEAESVDQTGFGANTRTMAGGLKNWTMEFEFLQDFAASNVDATCFPLVGATTTLIVRATATTVSATNPNYTGTGLITSYTPFGGALGDGARATLSVVSAGDLSRATS